MDVNEKIKDIGKIEEEDLEKSRFFILFSYW